MINSAPEEAMRNEREFDNCEPEGKSEKSLGDQIELGDRTPSSPNPTTSNPVNRNCCLQETIRSEIVLQIGDQLQEHPQRPTAITDNVPFATTPHRVETEEEEEEEQTAFALLAEIRQSFTWGKFFFAFFLGFLPTAWDVFTDIEFGMNQEMMGEETSAGLCYMFICLPPIFTVLLPALVSMVLKQWGKVADSTLWSILYVLTVCVIAVLITSAMAFAFATHPTIFKYPAILCSVFTLGIKIVAMFVHTTQIAEFSLYASKAESSYECSLQLLFLLHTWLSGGHLHLSAMVSSTLVIGKVGAENLLIKGQENMMEDKTFFEKVALLACYAPMVALTALFRIGSASVVLYHPHLLQPLTPAFAIFLTWIYLMCNITLLLTLLSILRTWLSKLRQLNTLELGLGLLNECTTVSVWGNLGREGSRRLQIGIASYHLLLNCSYLSWQLAEAGKMEKLTTVNPYSRPFFIVCNGALVCGPVSFILAIYQLIIFN